MSSSSSPSHGRPPATADDPPPGYPDLGPEPVAGVRLLRTPAVPTAVVRAEGVAMAGISEFFDSAFTSAFPALFAAGVDPAAPPFALYTRAIESPDAVVDLELGLPLRQPLDVYAVDPVEVEGLRVISSELPAGRLAVTTHLGPYDELGRAWGELMAAISALGYAPDVPFWEHYVTEPSPDVDPATLRTDLCCLVRVPGDA